MCERRVSWCIMAGNLGACELGCDHALELPVHFRVASYRRPLNCVPSTTSHTFCTDAAHPTEVPYIFLQEAKNARAQALPGERGE